MGGTDMEEDKLRFEPRTGMIWALINLAALMGMAAAQHATSAAAPGTGVLLCLAAYVGSVILRLAMACCLGLPAAPLSLRFEGSLLIALAMDGLIVWLWRAYPLLGQMWRLCALALFAGLGASIRGGIQVR